MQLRAMPSSSKNSALTQRCACGAVTTLRRPLTAGAPGRRWGTWAAFPAPMTPMHIFVSEKHVNACQLCMVCVWPGASLVPLGRFNAAWRAPAAQLLSLCRPDVGPRVGLEPGGYVFPRGWVSCSGGLTVCAVQQGVYGCRSTPMPNGGSTEWRIAQPHGQSALRLVCG